MSHITKMLIYKSSINVYNCKIVTILLKHNLKTIQFLVKSDKLLVPTRTKLILSVK